MTLPEWMTQILTNEDATSCWQQIAAFVLEQACQPTRTTNLHDDLIPLDRVLSDAAWPLWEAFPTHAPRTITALTDWWVRRGTNRAVLILDGLSLRELPLLLDMLARHAVTPLEIAATGAEVPTDTDHFAAALGLPGRSTLTNDHAPKGFELASSDRYTDVVSHPFVDCISDLPPRRDIVLWHTWPDNLFATPHQNAGSLQQSIKQVMDEDGLWQLIAHLRQGRQVVITSDHGYATTDRFASEETGGVKDYLAKVFGAMRLTRATDPLPTAFLPPPALTFDRWHVIIGQRKWKVSGGFPHICHGGLTLLEAFSPFLIIPEAA